MSEKQWKGVSGDSISVANPNHVSKFNKWEQRLLAAPSFIFAFILFGFVAAHFVGWVKFDPLQLTIAIIFLLALALTGVATLVHKDFSEIQEPIFWEFTAPLLVTILALVIYWYFATDGAEESGAAVEPATGGTVSNLPSNIDSTVDNVLGGPSGVFMVAWGINFLTTATKVCYSSFHSRK